VRDRGEAGAARRTRSHPPATDGQWSDRRDGIATVDRDPPQHGRGRKHLRPIVLDPWQREVVDQHPRPFLRGLLFSDGCRTINRFKTKLPSGRVADYAYPRYFFSNQSGDIRGLFCEYCEKLGIRWTQSNPRNISVSHRESVALLDGFVGPKR
jgi:hypothetical protein